MLLMATVVYADCEQSLQRTSWSEASIGQGPKKRAARSKRLLPCATSKPGFNVGEACQMSTRTLEQIITALMRR